MNNKETADNLEKIKQRFKDMPKQGVLAGGILIGVMLFGLYRFASFSPDQEHYHANFAVVINGEQEQFEDYSYYEELVACSVSEELTPKERVHMHEPENKLVHVHDHAVSWGHFFENIGFTIHDKHLSTTTKLYQEDEKTSVMYVLNGKVISKPARKQIASQDRLLVVVGEQTEDEALEMYTKVVPNNAVEFNESSDPGTCSSNEEHSMSDRFKSIFN